MADNTDEEHLENPVNNQPEIPADQINSPTDSETINPNQETENMEVHHHAMPLPHPIIRKTGNHISGSF